VTDPQWTVRISVENARDKSEREVTSIGDDLASGFASAVDAMCALLDQEAVTGIRKAHAARARADMVTEDEAEPKGGTGG